jgi:hypothetical protein
LALPVRNLDTVAADTPASSAIVYMVMFFFMGDHLICFFID